MACWPSARLSSPLSPTPWYDEDIFLAIIGTDKRNPLARLNPQIRTVERERVGEARGGNRALDRQRVHASSEGCN